MKTLRFGILLAAALIPAVGCQSFNAKSITQSKFFKSKTSTERDEVYFEPADSLGTIWVDSVVTHAGHSPVRGFTGRFLFYDEDGTPIRADGDLVIFGFDDSDGENTSKVPDRKFVIAKEELQSHYQESELGPNYYVWVPWDGLGGERKVVSLLPMLKTEDGRLVRGELQNNVLPGRQPETLTKSKSWVDRPDRSRPTWEHRQVSYQTRDDSGQWNSELEKRRQMQTTTINVPRGLGMQLRQPQTRIAGGKRPDQNIDAFTTSNRALVTRPSAHSPQTNMSLPPQQQVPQSATSQYYHDYNKNQGLAPRLRRSYVR